MSEELHQAFIDLGRSLRVILTITFRNLVRTVLLSCRSLIRIINSHGIIFVVTASVVYTLSAINTRYRHKAEIDRLDHDNVVLSERIDSLYNAGTFSEGYRSCQHDVSSYIHRHEKH